MGLHLLIMHLAGLILEILVNELVVTKEKGD